MKKLMAVLTMFLALAAPKAVQAFDDLLPEGVYLGAFGAANFPEVRKHHSKLKTGYFVSGSLGYHFCDGLRTELEGGYHHNSKKKHHHHHHDSSDVSGNTSRHGGNANTWSILVNGLYDFQTCWSVKPFIGAGIGYSSTQFKRHHHHSNHSCHCASSDCGCDNGHHHHRRKTGFAWQLIAGFGYALCDGWDISLQYRYFNPAATRIHNHDLGIGLGYLF